MTEEERKAEFKEKLRSIQWGLVPGGYRASNSRTNYDQEALDLAGFPTKEEVQDMRSDYHKTPVTEAKVFVQD